MQMPNVLTTARSWNFPQRLVIIAELSIRLMKRFCYLPDQSIFTSSGSTAFFSSRLILKIPLFRQSGRNRSVPEFVFDPFMIPSKYLPSPYLEVSYLLFQPTSSLSSPFFRPTSFIAVT